jgi:hypothetical protein
MIDPKTVMYDEGRRQALALKERLIRLFREAGK